MISTQFLGNTDLKVSIVGLGTSPLSGDMGKIEERTALEILHTALNMGVNFFDVANSYGDGHAETLLGMAFQHKRDKVIIATKGGTEVGGAKLRMNFQPSFIKNSVEESLYRLKTDYIDLYQLHGPRPWEFQNEHVFEVLEKLKASGKIRYYGISLASIEDYFIAVNETKAQVFQVEYNILEQRPQKRMFPDVMARRVGIIARVPLAQGILTGKYTAKSRFPPDDMRYRINRWYLKEQVAKVESLVKQMGFTGKELTEKALRFCFSHPAVSTVIVGAKTVSQITENIEAAAKGPLTEEELLKITTLARSNFYIKGTTFTEKIVSNLSRRSFYRSILSMHVWKRILSQLRQH